MGLALNLANSFGFLFPAEVFLIQALVRSLPEKAVLVCIGVGAGTGSLAMAEMRPDAQLVSVDISEGGPLGGFSNERNAFKFAGLKLPVQILGNSQEVHAEWPVRSNGALIDLLFIDGDHAAHALQGDIDGWLPYVRPGGYVLFHDYQSAMWGDVTGVVDANMNVPGWRYVHQVDTLIAFQRGGGR
jgi:predicted O-methyltransferase YrrM